MIHWLRRKVHDLFSPTKEEEVKTMPLAVEGVAPAPLTAEPDDAELAAEALLASLASEDTAAAEPKAAEQGTAEYYRQLADRIEKAQAVAVQRTTRFVAFCEQELKKRNLPKNGPGSLALLEAELYKRIDTVEREGGELKRRWQHCLAEVTVRLMEERESPTLTLPEGEGRELRVKNRAATESQLTEK